MTLGPSVWLLLWSGSALAVGVAVWALVRARQAREQSSVRVEFSKALATAETRVEEAARRLADLHGELANGASERVALQRDLAASQQDRARLAAELDAERKAAQEKVAVLQQA